MDNPPAFPSSETFEEFNDGLGRYETKHVLTGGMTMRQWYKGEAMKRLLSNPEIVSALANISNNEGKKSTIGLAKISAIYAESQLEEDQKQRNKS